MCFKMIWVYTVARLVSSSDTFEHFVLDIYEKPGLENISYWFD